MNNDKTDAILFGSAKLLKSISHDGIVLNEQFIKFSSNVRNLGVHLDNNLNMNFQINKLTQICFHELRKLSSIRSLIDSNAAQKLASAFVLSRIDYCNSLLFGLQEQQFYKLQKIQNSAARIVSKSRRTSHITPVLRELHWLPVKARVEYKAAIISFNAFNETGPSYLKQCISHYNPPRNLRSAHNSLATTHSF